MSKAFGEALQDLRQEYSLSVSALARHVGCSPSYISRLEYGDRTPSFSLVVLIANTFQLSGPERIAFFSSANFSEHPISRIEAVLLHDIQQAQVSEYQHRIVQAVLTAPEKARQLPLI